ncbi:membrane protein [Desmospora sp. 8437]|nr:membrane protein [Desmospora sp. 8437]
MRMNPDLLLVLLIVIGLIGRSPIIATAASLLLILKLTHLERFFPAVERRGLEIGLLFLTIAVLVPFASGRISLKEVLGVFTSVPGILAIAGGAIATYMNGKGLDLLKVDPQMIIGLVIGSIFGILFLRGIPVGPLMAAGITAFLMKIAQWIWS